MNPGGGSGWDEPPLDIQIPDDARELDRDVLAYRRELRAKRRRNRLKRLAAPFGPFAARGTVMPLLASILAVCLVAGAMLSVATFSPATSPAEQVSRSATATASQARPSPSHASTSARAPVTSTATSTATTSPSPASPSPASTVATRASRSVSPPASALPTTGPTTGRTHPAVRASGPGSPGTRR